MTWPYKHVVAAIYVAALFLDLLDMTVVNVALPALERAFGGVDPAKLQWVNTVYLLALAVVTPISGWIGDRFGTKRAFLASLVIFTGASALCGLAWNLWSLIAFRALQGVGGGLLAPVGMTMLLRAYPVSERATAAAVLSVPVAVAPALGPVLGGYLVSYYDWRWIFFINVPVGMVTFVCALRLLKEHREPATGPLDVKGFVLVSAGLVAVLYGLTGLSESAGDRLTAGVIGIIGAGLLVGFARAQLTSPAPLIDLRVFRDRGFSAGNAVMFIAAVGFGGILFLLPLLLQLSRGLSAFGSGLVTAAHAVGILLMMPAAARLYPRLGPRLMLVTGMLGTAVTTIGIVLLATAGRPWAVGAMLLAAGAAYGMTIVALQTSPFTTLASSMLGRATAAFNVTRQVGLSVGVALTALILSMRLATRGVTLEDATTQVSAIGAFQEALVLGAIVSLVGGLAALTVPRDDRTT